MATPEEILSILENLLHAFPGQKISRNTLQIYVDHLSDIHPRLLQMCADNLVASATWFPRISDIRAEAAKIVGSHWVSTWQPPQNYLWARYRQLEHQFWHHRILDPDAWIDLANSFERRDQPFSATGARRRLKIFQQLLAEESQ
jgi:hypothetical protein